MTYRHYHIAIAWLPDGSWRPSIDGEPLTPAADRELAVALARHTVDQLWEERDRRRRHLQVVVDEKEGGRSDV